MSDNSLTVAEAALYADTTPYIIRKALKLGELRGRKLGGRAGWRIMRDELDRWLRGQNG